MMTFVLRDQELAQLDAMLLAQPYVIIEGVTGVGKSALVQQWLKRRPQTRALQLSLREVRSFTQALDALAQALELKRSGQAPWELALLHDAMEARELTHLILDDVCLDKGALATLVAQVATSKMKLLLITPVLGHVPDMACSLRLSPWRVGSWEAPATQALLAFMGSERHKRWSEPEQAQLIELAARFDGLPAMMMTIANQLRFWSVAQLLERLNRPQYLQLASFEQALTLLREQLPPESWRALLLCSGALDCAWRTPALEVILGHEGLAYIRPLLERGAISGDDEPATYHIMRALREVAATFARRELTLELEQAQQRLEAWLSDLGQTLYFTSLADAFSPVCLPLFAHRLELKQALVRVLDSAPGEALSGLLLGITLVMRREGRFDELKALIERAKLAHGGAHDERLALTFLLIEADLDELAGHEELGYARIKSSELTIEQLPEATQRLVVLRMLESANHAYDMETGQQMLERWERLREAASPRQRAMALAAMGQFFTYGHDYPKAEQTLLDAIEAARAIEAPDIEGKAQMVLGFTLQYMGKMHLAQQAMARSMELYRALGRADALAHALRTQAWLFVDMGRHQNASPLLDEMVQVGRAYGLSWAVGVGRFLQGQLELDRGQHQLARILYEQARYHLTMIQDEDHLMALDLYGAINEALGADLEGATQALEASMARQQERFNRWSRVQTGLSLSALYVKAPPTRLAQARSALEQAQALIPEGNMLLTVQRDVHEAIIGLQEVQLELEQRKLYQAQALLTRLLRQLRRGLDPLEGEDEPIWRQSIEIRLGLRLLWWTLDQTQQRRLRFALMDPEHEALLVDQELRAWRPPQDPRWVEMPKRYTPWRLLQALLHAHEDGEAVSAAALTASLWPEEAEREGHSEALVGRLYVTINELRKEGLGELLLVTGRGYQLAPKLRVITAPGYAELASWLD